MGCISFLLTAQECYWFNTTLSAMSYAMKTMGEDVQAVVYEDYHAGSLRFRFIENRLLRTS